MRRDAQADFMRRWEEQSLSELVERFGFLEAFHKRMCERAGPRRWEALAINYSLRINVLECAVREAAAYMMTDNSELRRRIVRRLEKLVPEEGIELD